MPMRPRSGHPAVTSAGHGIVIGLSGNCRAGYDRPMDRILLRLLAAVGVAFLAACSSMQSPPRPAMVAFDANGDYGFSETKLSDREYRVRYVEPRLQIANDRTSRETAIEAAKQRSYDLALWRAAQIAQSAGFSTIEVVQDRRDADVDVTDRRYRRVWPFVGYGYYGYPMHGYRPWFPYHYDEYPYFPYYPYEDDYLDRQTAWARVSATVTVKFAEEPRDGTLDAATTVSSMQKRYATFTFPPAR